MQHDYYKEYYELERSNWWFVAREKIIAGLVRKMIRNKQIEGTTIRILNIGCGPGRSSENLSQFGHVTSIEYDQFCCEFASKKTGLEILHGSITELPFADKSFDLVCAFDVIEHVENDRLAVSEMKRVGKDDAVLFITVPAFMSLWSHHDVINHHFRRYKRNQIKELFESDNDGKMLFSSYFNFFLFLPIYIFRQISNLLKTGEKRTGSGSDFEGFKPGIVNTILFNIFFSEKQFVTNGIRFPFGVSILYIWKKQKR